MTKLVLSEEIENEEEEMADFLSSPSSGNLENIPSIPAAINSPEKVSPIPTVMDDRV